MAIHLTGQFRILQYRFSKMCDMEDRISEKDEKSMLTRRVYRIYETFKKYVRHHQALINYCKMLENVYTMIILGQVLVFSMLICLFGYQVLLVSIWRIANTFIFTNVPHTEMSKTKCQQLTLRNIPAFLRPEKF